MRTLYDQDFYLWTQQTAAALREGRLQDIDIENTAEEIESLGRSDKRTLRSHLKVLAMHLLKWQYQPDLRGRSWLATIQVQRDGISDLLEESPSLKPTLEQALQETYPKALREALTETGLPPGIFPAYCPWTIEQILNPEFHPES